MVIDPVCSLVFEAETEEDDVMRRPPRLPEGPLFSGPLISLHSDDRLVTVTAGAALLVVLELLKPLWRRRLQS